jgi:hypothetical protein
LTNQRICLPFGARPIRTQRFLLVQSSHVFFCKIYGNKKNDLGGGGLVLKYCRHVLPKSYLNPKFSKDLPLGFTLHRLVMKSLILGNIDALTCIIFQ